MLTTYFNLQRLNKEYSFKKHFDTVQRVHALKSESPEFEFKL